MYLIVTPIISYAIKTINIILGEMLTIPLTREQSIFGGYFDFGFQYDQENIIYLLEEGSVAHKEERIRIGDIIKKINNKTMDTSIDTKAAIDEAGPTITLIVERIPYNNGKTLIILKS